MTLCAPDNTTWCCGESNNCCGTTAAVTIPPVFGAQVSSTSIPSSTTVTVFPSVSPVYNSSINGGAIAGIVVGILAAASIAGLIGWALGRRGAGRHFNATTVVTPPTRHEEVNHQNALPRSLHQSQASVRTQELETRTWGRELDSRNI